MIRYEVHEHVATVTLDNPHKLNAVSSADLAELADIWRRFAADPHANAAVLRGAGERAFCAGTDLKDPVRTSDAFEQGFWTDVSHGYYQNIEDGFPLWKPVISAIHGHCVGEGLVMALGTDIRLCSEDARFSLPEVRIGSNTVTGAAILSRHVSEGDAAMLALTGDTIDAAEAYRMGIVQRTYPREELFDAAQELAARIAANSPHAVQAIKGVMRMARTAPLETVLTAGASLRYLIRQEPAFRQAAQEFSERRKADPS